MNATALKPLPVRSVLALYKEQATNLIKEFRAGNPTAMQRIRQHHPRLPGRANTNDRNKVTDSEIRKTKLTVVDAQTVVARWHGFESWAELAKHVELLSKKRSRILQFELAVEAIISGDLATLTSLLRENPDLARDRSTREHHATLLHYVGANGVESCRQKTPKNAVQVAKLLLNAGAEVDADLEYRSVGGKLYPERRGSTTLGLVATSIHPAAAGVQIALLKTLLDAGSAVDGLRGGWNPLIAALHNGRGQAAKFLAKHGAKLDLEGAAGVGQLDAVKSYFNDDGNLKASATNAQMESGFAWACEYGRTRVVDFLVKRGIDIGAKVRHHGQTGLHWAAFGGHINVVKLLLKRKAPANIKDESFGGTPLGWALYGWGDPPPEAERDAYYEIVAQLVAAGSIVESAWLVDRSPLDEKVRSDARMVAALGGKMAG
jgi:ankyrin repeat protein